jgi:type IV pilus assembly protein PilE
MRGHSLLELMLVLVVISILLSVALPGYRQLVLRSQRVAGKIALMEVLALQERHLLNYKRYGASLAELGLQEEYYVGSTAGATGPAKAVYKLELAFEEGGFVGAMALPRNAQLGDSQCGTLSLSRWGVQGVSGSFRNQPDLCW